MKEAIKRFPGKAYKGFVCIGNFWVKRKKKGGGDFLAGKIALPDGTEVRVSAFMNKNKRNSRDPDYSVFRHLNKSEREARCKEQDSSADQT